MTDLTPRGISKSGSYEGQNVFLGDKDIPVDTAGNEIAFATPQGSTGVSGFTGLTSTLQGLTGPSFFGATGIRGITGPFGPTGVAGPQGITGLIGFRGNGFGNTGLTGDTGIRSATGITGDTGIRGLIGPDGVTGFSSSNDNPGATGIAGNSYGATGIAGATGFEGNIQGFTGLTSLGAQGLQGFTGLRGVTGLSGTAHVDAQTGAADTISTFVPANTLTRNNDQLDFAGIAFTADDADPTTLTLTLGSTTLLSKTFGLLSDVCRVSGTIIRTGDTAQIVGLQILFDSGATYATTATASEDLTTDLTLSLVASSNGDGNAVAELVTTKINDLS